jgi:hypothetical protein
MMLFVLGASPAAFAQTTAQPAKDSVAAPAQKLNPGTLLPAKMSLAVAPQSLSEMTTQMGSGTTIAHLSGAQANKLAASDNATGRSFKGELKVGAH